MAKKEAGSLAQQLIPGTHDPVPKPVQDKVDEYVAKRKKAQKLKGEENHLRDEAIALMKEHSIDRVSLDDGKDLILEEEPKLKTKKRKAAPEAGSSEEGEEE